MPGTSGDAIEDQIFGQVRPGVQNNPTYRRYPVIAVKLPFAAARVRARLESAIADIHPWWRRMVIDGDLERLPRTEMLALAGEGARRFEHVMRPHTLAALLCQSLYEQIRVLSEKAGKPGLEIELVTGYGDMAETDVVADLWEVSRDRLTLDEFVGRHGYHGPSEGELSSQTWRENRTPLHSLLVAYREMDESRAPRLVEAKRGEERVRAEKELIAALPAARRAPARLILRLAAKLIPLRGSGKSAFLQCTDVARAVARTYGNQLADEGVIERPEDIFMLTLDELQDSPPPADIRDRVAERRAIEADYRSTDVPDLWDGDARADAGQLRRRGRGRRTGHGHPGEPRRGHRQGASDPRPGGRRAARARRGPRLQDDRPELGVDDDARLGAGDRHRRPDQPRRDRRARARHPVRDRDPERDRRDPHRRPSRGERGEGRGQGAGIQLMRETTPTEATESTFSGANGLEIFWREWLPAAIPRAVVVIAHGVGEHSGRYGHVAADLTAHGYAVYALDHRGHGLSEGDRCVIDRLERAVEDIGTLIAMARERHRGKRAILLGHSMGGCLSIAYAVRRQDEIDALVLSAPVAVLESASAAMRLIARLLSSVVPRLGVFPVDTDAISTDPAVVRDYENDPLVHHGKIPVRTLAELTSEIETFPERVPTLRLPLLCLHGAEDTLVPPEASRMVEREAGSASKRLVFYPGMRHEILNEPDQEKVLTDIRAWLDEVD